ncbi:MAG: peptidyl-prolyl cis-trans isomerase [Planctomycetes bacterium]|nr:peptidyl-prolyl cis-trans isomerase [Planctomycetota bacterium]
MIAAGWLFLTVGALAATEDPTRLGPERLREWSGVDPVHQRGLATVDGVDVGADAVLAKLFATHTELVYAALESTVRAQVLQLEAERLGVFVDVAALELEVGRVLKSQQDRFAFEAGPDQDFERYIASRYRITPEAYRSVIRREVLEQMLLVRTVRLSSRQAERMVCRVIVVKEREKADELAEKLAEGANFARLAEQNSIDRSAVRGGLLAPIARSTAEPLLVHAAELEPGALAPVEPLTNEGVTVFRLLKVDAHLPADPRPYAEQRADLEAELEERPVEAIELAEWDRAVRARHAIDVKLAKP